MKKINGNCKAVRCLTNGKFYHSVKEAAIDNGVHFSAISYAIRKGGRCNGKEFGFESNMEKNIIKMASNLSQREISAEEMAEFYAWKAEQEALRKANELRELRKGVLRDKINHLRGVVQKAEAKWNDAMNQLMAYERELETLMDEEV